MDKFWATTMPMDIVIGTVKEELNRWSLNRMRKPKSVSRPKSASTLTKKTASRGHKVRIGVESTDRFFARMRDNARKLDRGEIMRPAITLSFENPADLLEVMTPARLRLMRQVRHQAISLSTLAAALSRDCSAVRRDVALLESKYLLRTRKATNPGHGVQTLIERAAASIELSATV
jgi:predicted transcriptional regulator